MVVAQGKRAEVTVYGAGIFGLSIGFACAARGARVAVQDPRGVAGGASGGLVGALAPHAPERWDAIKAFQFEALLAAETFWHRVAAISGMNPGYGRTGRLQPVSGEGALARARARAIEASELWQGRAVWEVIPEKAAGAFAPATPSGWLVRDTLSARLHPRRACQALAAAIVALGGHVAADPVPESGRIVWATGYEGLADLRTASGHPAGAGVKGQAVLLAHAASAAAQIYADRLHLVPHDDGTVAVGSTTERDWEDAGATDGQCDALVAQARSLCPALAEAPVLARWAGVRPRTRNRLPLLGRHPVRSGDFIANGGFKIGFGLAPRVAEVMADLVLEGRDAIPEAFRPETALWPAS